MRKCNYFYNGKKYTEKQIMKMINEGKFFPSLTSELQNVADMLGIDVSEIEIIKGLIDGDAVGQFVEDGRILISELAGNGIVYHEAFHKVFQTYLTDAQRKDLLDQVKESDLKYLREIYPELSIARLKEEFLAEEFREYALNEGKIVTVRSGVWGKMLNFLEKLIDLFSSTYGKKRLYSNIKKGVFKGRKPRGYKSNTMKAKIRLSSVFTNKQAYEIMQNVRFSLALELTKTINGNTLDWDLNKVNDLIKGRLPSSKINAIINNVIDYTIDELNDIDPNKADIFEDYINDNEGAFFEEIIPILEEFKLTVDFADDIDVNDESGVPDSFAFKASFESDEKEKMSGFVKMILSTVPKLDIDGNKMKTEELGLNYATPLSEILPQMYNLASKLPSYMIIPAFANSSSKQIQWLKSLFESNEPQWHNFKADLIRTFNNTRHRFTIVNLEDGQEQVIDSNRNTVGKMLESRFKTILSDLLTQFDLEKYGAKSLFGLINRLMAASDSMVDISLSTELNEAIKSVFTGLIDEAVRRDDPKKHLLDLVNIAGIGTITNVLKKQEEFEKNNSMSVTSLTGKKLQEISLHNNMSIMLGFAERLAKADSVMTDIWYNQIDKLDSLIQYDSKGGVDKKMTILRHEFPQLFRASTENLHWVKKIKESMTGGIYVGPELNIFLGTSFKDIDVETNDMELNDLAYSDIIAFNQGFHLGMKHGDRSTYFGFRNVSRFKGNYGIEGIKEIYKKETDTMFLDFVDDTGFGRKDTTNIKPDIDVIVKNMIETLVSYGILFYDKGVLQFKEGLMKDVPVKDTMEFLYKFAGDRSLNYLNEQMLMYGDPRLFKDGADMFKRLTGFSSTGKPLATGEVIEGIIDEKMKNLDTFNNKKFIREVVATDHKFTSKMVDHYDNGVEYDGASYISWSTSVAYNIRAGLNTKEKELLYKIQNLAFKKLKTVKNKDEAKGALNDVFNSLHKEVLNYLYETYIPSLTINEEEDQPVTIENKQKELEEINANINAKAVELTTKLLEPQVPLKPQYMGQFIYKDYDSWLLSADNVIAMRKTAYFQLDPIIALSKFGSNYHKSLMYMESNKIDFIHTHGASKVGNDPARFVNIYSKEGEYILDTHDISKHETFLDWKYLKNQVEMSTKEKSQTIDSTQKRKIVLSNLQIFNDDGTLNEAETNKMYVWAAEYILEYATLYKRKDIHFSSKFSEKLPKLILSLGKGKPDNIKEALEDVAESLQMDTSPLRDQIEQMLMSAVSSEFVSLKRPGNMAVQQPVTLMETGNRTMNKGKIESSDELKFGMYNGKFIAEIMMPLPQKYIAKAFKILENYNANLSPGQKAKDFNLYNAVDLFNKRWGGKMQTVGLRIPNQQVSSTAPLTVKEFLLPTAANAIIVPTEIIWMSGGDFDIDKLSLYLPSLNDNGNLVKTRIDESSLIQSYMRHINENMDKSDVSTVYESKENYDKLNLINYVYDKQYLSVSEIMQVGTAEMKSMFVEDFNKANENIYNAIKNDKAFIEFEKLNAEEKRTNDEIYNKILDLEFKLLTNRPNEMMKETSDDVFKKKKVQDPAYPDDDTKMIDISTLGKLKTLIKKASENPKNTQEVKRAYEKLLKQLESSSTIDIKEIYSPVMHWTKKSHYADSKAGVGISASGIAHQAVTQFNKMYFNSIVKRLVKNEAGNTVNVPQEVSFILDKWRLDNLTDITGMDIMENLSIILSSQVDAGKDPYANLMGINTKTLGAFTTMIRFGIDFYSAILLLNQPVVKEHVEKIQRAASVLDTEITDEKIRTEERTIIENFIDSGLKDSFTGNVIDILEKHIENPNEIYIFNQTMYDSSNGKEGFYTPEQLDTVMLGMFVIFKNASTDLIKHSRLHNSDTQRIKNEFEYLQIQNTQPSNRLYSDKPYEGENIDVNRVLAMQYLTTHIGRIYYNRVTKLNKYTNPAIIEIVNIFPPNLKERMYNTIRNDFMAYVVSNDPSMRERFDKHDNLEMFRQINSHRDNGFINNMFLSYLGGQYIIKDGIQNNITLDINYLSGEFLLLPESLQESISIQVLKQSAFNPGPYSLFRILPYESSIMKEAGEIFKSYSQEELDKKFTDFIYEDFWLNNRKFSINDVSVNDYTKERYSKIQNRIEKIGYTVSNNAVNDIYNENEPVSYTGTYYSKPYDNAVVRDIKRAAKVEKTKFVYEDLFGYENVFDEPLSMVDESVETKNIIIQMQSDNIKKILEGVKTTTTRGESQAKEIGLKIGESGITIFNGESFKITNRGLLSISEAGGKVAMEKSENFENNTPKYQQTKDWLEGKGKLYVYDIERINETKPTYYEGDIKPSINTIFVFGSNPEGRHGAGAAKVAVNKFGAKYGQGEGLQGNAYALPTKDLRVKENNGFKSISPEQITENIKKLYEVAKQNPTKQFKVGYRNTTEKSLNGYTGIETLEMFNDAGTIPSNIIFSKEWVDTGRLNITNQITPKGTINVYWGQAESATSTKILSNLASRKFTYQGKEYGSVEHAYQSLKSGVFDQATYNAYVNAGGYGTKIRGKAVTKGFDNLQLMKDLVVESFIQNPTSEATKKLLQYDKFTHNTNEIIDTAFLEGLILAQRELSTVKPTVVKAEDFKNGDKVIVEGELGFFFINTALQRFSADGYIQVSRTIDDTATMEVSINEIIKIVDDPNIKPIITEAERVEIRKFYLKHKDTTLKEVTPGDINELINQGLSGEFILNKLKECKSQ